MWVLSSLKSLSILPSSPIWGECTGKVVFCGSLVSLTLVLLACVHLRKTPGTFANLPHALFFSVLTRGAACGKSVFDL